MDPNEQPPQPPEAPDQETMEQIRRRRVAKLGEANKPPAAASTSSPGPATSPASNSAAQSKENKKESPSAPPPAPAQPKPQPTATGTASAPRKINITPRPEELLENYVDYQLSQIFRLTVDPNRPTDAHGHQLIFLAGIHQELVDAGGPLKLSADSLDSAVYEAANSIPHDKPLFHDYLLPCWKRATRAVKAYRGPAGSPKEEVLKEARRLCFSNCIFALSMPEYFGREKAESLAPFLLRGLENESGVCLDFYNEAMARIDENDAILPLFTLAMVEISTKLSSLTMNDDYKPCVNVLLTYSKFAPLLNAVAQDPRFQMAQSAPNVEKNTILGPFFRISPLQTEVTRTYFTGPRTMDKGHIKNAQNALQITLAAHQDDLKSIINAFVRASTETRNKVLDWFAYAMNVNHKRRALQVDPKEVSSDGFMMNVTVILDCLCEPFMDSTFSKVDRIDVGYFRRDPRVDISDETKLNADQSQSEAFYKTKVDGTSNFITEVFFLTLAAHHYGSEATNSKMKNLDKDIKFYQKHIEKMESERVKFANRPTDLAMFEVSLRRHTEVLEKSMSLKFAIEGVLLEEKMQSRSLQFMRYVSVWLLRVASQSAYTPDRALQLPLPETQPEAFSCLPEYALQDIVDNFKFIFRYIPQIILSAVGDEMIALCITFLQSSEYIRNPYLKSSLVSLLFSGTWPTYHLKRGVLGDLLTNSTFANNYLLHAVMKFYIECESTGAHTQFYDKFNIRYEIFQVIKCVWSNDIYKQQLTQQSKTNRAFFVRFVNLLMNDATYVLDEALSKFPKIQALQESLNDPSLPPQERQKIEEELRTNEDQATSYMQLANETVSMMKLFTSALSESFTMPEIVQRLAGMLDYNLEVLTVKSRNLKVDKPEKYHFNPRTLLPEIVEIYLNLGGSTAFVEAVAADGRSYKPETFAATTRILRGKFLKGHEEIAAWEALCHKISIAKEILDRAEQDFGDVPPEFEDPIMGDLMKDPVVLPSSHIVDRSTIVQHLLSDQKDPFTRQPMTIDDVIPAIELLEKIEAWKTERLAKAKNQVASAMDLDG
ncbi:hypothetical protein GQ53DRAFT_428166 [Thozetella sp. PMI_491]|nr:hypothetical protein GQ53DRAFT_428166 [Thozetella sp. PMI_491]